MYLPTAFEESRLDILHPFMKKHPFVTLVTSGADGMDASHIPVIVDETRGAMGTIAGHLAIANPQWRNLEAGYEALVIFQGPHAYISPSWYVTPGVPTWNYVVAHAYGQPRILTDPAAVRTHLVRLTAAFESGTESPWTPQKLPKEMLEKLEHSIVAFEIEITRLEGKFKLGQNRVPHDRERAIHNLKQTRDLNSHLIARLMANPSLAGADPVARPKPNRPGPS